MSPAVNPRRRYDASRRRAQAEQNRSAILEAARARFLEEGYAATTMPSVASDAGVSVETVYKAFGNKAGLVKAVFDVAVVGDDEPVPLMEREFVQRNIAERDPVRKLHAYGTHLARTVPRAGPVQLVVRAAAAGDAAAAEVWAQLQEERLLGMTAFAAHLAEGGHLREGVSRAQARDVLWVHSSVELWDLLVLQRGWSNTRYGRWVGAQLVAALL
jgi:AcrR family transcriptional regulator